MSAQHSKGPWRVYPAGTRVPGYQVHDRIVADTFNGRSLSDGPSEEDLQLMAASPDLLSALADIEVLYLRDGEGWNDCFERVGELFHKDTGYLRPGKDSGAAAGDDREARDKAWEAWIAGRLARARAAIAKAGGAS